MEGISLHNKNLTCSHLYDSLVGKFSVYGFQVVPFAMFEYQSKWIAGALSGRLGLPLVEEMMDNISSFTPSSKFLAYLSAILITWEILS